MKEVTINIIKKVEKEYAEQLVRGSSLVHFAQLVANRCAEIIEAQDVDPAVKTRMAHSIRKEFGDDKGR